MWPHLNWLNLAWFFFFKLLILESFNAVKPLGFETITQFVDPIDYRCDNRRFWLSAHNCQVPTPTSQNLELEQQMKSTIYNLQIYLPNKGKFWEVGVGDGQSMQDSFFEFADEKVFGRVNDRHFWNHGVFSYAMIPRCLPNSRVFFFSSSHL